MGIINISARVTHVTGAKQRYLEKLNQKAKNKDQIVQTFLSSTFLDENQKLVQFEAITSAKDITSESSRTKGPKEYLSSDVMLEWQLEPIAEMAGLTFEVLSFDVRSRVRDKQEKDYSLTNHVIDQKVISKIQIESNETNLITNDETGLVYEVLSFDLNAKQILVSEL